ncbi:MAG: outer membrane lipoprotein-sorting protein [Gammaproteobacteria bacterium]|nr:outer membrane lipoprotein-sorting protein [Gammaproteobacteria bacterium]
MLCRKLVITAASAALFSVSFGLSAGVPKDLPYPTGAPSADEIARQVYFVNHFYAVKNYGITKKDRAITVLVNKAAGETPTTITLERYLNNDYNDGAINAMDLAIFRSGKLRGTGMLITDFTDDSKSQSYSIWLPALRKIRRFAEPAHDDAWGGTDFTFGDVTLRKPTDETHELLGSETFNDCLGAISEVEVKYLPTPPEPSCAHKGKTVYKLKSTTKRQNWWYDDRVSYIDTKTFTDYRTDYFKGGQKIKVIDRDWGSLNISDPRAQTWRYWYGKTLATGHETWAVIPAEVVEFNQDWESSMWSEQTLRKIKR